MWYKVRRNSLRGLCRTAERPTADRSMSKNCRNTFRSTSTVGAVRCSVAPGPRSATTCWDATTSSICRSRTPTVASTSPKNSTWTRSRKLAHRCTETNEAGGPGNYMHGCCGCVRSWRLQFIIDHDAVYRDRAALHIMGRNEHAHL